MCFFCMHHSPTDLEQWIIPELLPYIFAASSENAFFSYSPSFSDWFIHFLPGDEKKTYRAFSSPLPLSPPYHLNFVNFFEPFPSPFPCQVIAISLFLQLIYVCHVLRTDTAPLHPCPVGSSDFDKIFENCFASCSFGMAKYMQDYFRKGIFLNFLMVLSFFGFCVDKF